MSVRPRTTLDLIPSSGSFASGFNQDSTAHGYFRDSNEKGKEETVWIEMVAGANQRGRGKGRGAV